MSSYPRCFAAARHGWWARVSVSLFCGVSSNMRARSPSERENTSEEEGGMIKTNCWSSPERLS